ncbi:uncharacterized protein LOC126719537 [Quercus robur]|uniref:uncharacterized protein LOC126719308 n=1 Tax=Quercus robur TaxID=38942 RepID=UPI0021619AE1|nr:uncharacterized protein LOC126719308 [Quercus robur]XP_050278249.1 uncharacterized protein LOC126719537 [Quercus robur]
MVVVDKHCACFSKHCGNNQLLWDVSINGYLDDSSKELQDCFFKLVVSMGSAPSGILGEATVNMIGYMSSPAPVPVSLRLKKCNHGTILQVQALEEELKLMKDGKQNQRESSTMKVPSLSKTHAKVTPVHEDMKPSKKNEVVKNTSQQRDNKNKQSLKNAQVQELAKDHQKLCSNQYQREDGSGNEILDESPLAVGVDPASKIQLIP